MALQLAAPAKVNLYLRVVGRRADGYHELETVFHAVDLVDEVTAERRSEPGVSLEVVGGSGTGLPVAAGDDNLVVRAGRAFLAAAPTILGGLRFHLRKRIPAGGGLGGGSSDAAAALLLADELCGSPLGRDRLRELAAELGADVPFFIDGGTQIGRGIGTALTPLPRLNLDILLILPPFGTATARVYENYRPQLIESSTVPTIRSIEAQFSQGISLATLLRNDLQMAATSAYPELDRLRRRICQEGFPLLQVSGSGSTMFLAFEQREGAIQAIDALRPLAAAESMVLVQTGSAPVYRSTRVSWPDDLGRSTKGQPRGQQG